MIRVWAAGALAVALVTGCARSEDRISFDGQYFRSHVKRLDRGAPDQFRVTVRRASASIAGALEAGRYEATRYCVLTFGNSVITWTVGPDRDPQTVTLDGDTLVLEGTCEG